MLPDLIRREPAPWLASSLASRWCLQKRLSAPDYILIHHRHKSGTTPSSVVIVCKRPDRMPALYRSLLICLVLLAWWVFHPAPVHASVLVDSRSDVLSLGRHVELLEDPTGVLTVDDLATADVASRFTASTSDAPSFGFGPSVYWARLVIESRLATPETRLLVLEHALTQRVDVHVIPLQSAGAQPLKYSAGSAIRISARPFRHRNGVFPLRLEPGQSATVYVRIASEGTKIFDLSLWETGAFARDVANEFVFLGILIGISIGLIGYNLFVWLVVRESMYGYYTVFLLAGILFLMNQTGLAQLYFWGEYPYMTMHSSPFSVALMAWSSCVFAMRFLATSGWAGYWHGLLRGLAVISGVSALLVWVLPLWAAILLLTPLTAAMVLLLIGVGGAGYRRRVPAASYYLLAWTALLLATAIQWLRQTGLVPSTPFTEYAQYVGVALEGILLSVAMAARIRSLKEEREKAQQQAVEQKQLALETVSQYSRKLEAEVKARTAELVDAQQKLVASEKMMALGVFTAGMAHEINNPANFISAGAQNAESQVRKLDEFIRELMGDEGEAEIRREFDEHFGKIHRSMGVVLDGVKRIESVVKSLRAANPEGNVGMQPVNPVELLLQAWSVVQPNIRVEVDTVTQFSTTTLVECAVSDMHQVFIALLTNAGHALEDAAAADPTHQARVMLSTRVKENRLQLTVADNGPGIPADIQDRIFDPFFTTREVGRGSGLGLSMARDVVRRHGGSLEFVSLSGDGAAFTVSLPLSQP
jgi:signal transduction histidine kinase